VATANLACLLVLGISVALAAQKKPSSLHTPGATVRITHRHESVIDCRVAAAENACLEQRVKAPAAVDVLWAPISDPLISTPNEGRSPLRLSLPRALGASAIDAQVPAGAWQFSWFDQQVALRVPSGGRLQIQLSTISGRCIRQQAVCKVDGTAPRRATHVPPEFAMTN